MTECSIQGCSQPGRARGWCWTHYSQWRRRKITPTLKPPRGPSPRPVEPRFWAKVQKTEGCWLWQGAVARGYGKITVARKLVLAHRLSWEIHFGTPPDGLLVLHRCDVRNCVNPDHLFLGTTKDNMDDMWAKGRHYRDPETGRLVGRKV